MPFEWINAYTKFDLKWEIGGNPWQNTDIWIRQSYEILRLKLNKSGLRQHHMNVCNQQNAVHTPPLKNKAKLN